MGTWPRSSFSAIRYLCGADHLLTSPVMPTHVVKNPEVLLWGKFKTRSNQIPDPNDGHLMDALTRFKFTFPKGFMPKAYGSQFGLVFPEKWQITITPDCQLWSGANKTAELLAHEQLHYFFGFVTARALVNDLLARRVASKKLLEAAINPAIDLHLLTRAEALNIQYDDDTSHGANTTKQSQWETAMDTCLKDDTATQLMGLDL